MRKNEAVHERKYEVAASLRGDERLVINEINRKFPLIKADALPKMVDLFSDGEDGWGVVAIMAHNGEAQEPMKPMTMMRNSLGIDEGGNGVPIDHKKYKESVEFWKGHVSVK